MPPQTVRASCLCEAVRLELTLPAKFCVHCHCDNCRRAHGAAFVTYAGFEAERMKLIDAEGLLVRYRTDTGATRSFCSRCGTTLLYEGPRWPGEVHVARALIEGELGLAPEAHAYVDQKADWHEITDELPRLGGDSGVEPVDD